ncbi:hypothetical protein Cpir12675_005479 [Ceratocystis pirilliformis]|uniref:RCC1-like domain-containing protein n=1 Tax=Ceratocystis pirilliformis TaxID=259994 RepID=A0ABR3YPM5_9PEZI
MSRVRTTKNTAIQPGKRRKTASISTGSTKRPRKNVDSALGGRVDETTKAATGSGKNGIKARAITAKTTGKVLAHSAENSVPHLGTLLQQTPVAKIKTRNSTPRSFRTNSVASTVGTGISRASTTCTSQCGFSRRINSRPQQRYEIFVCGTGLRGELGLGANDSQTDPEYVTVSRTPIRHPYLDTNSVGVVQIAIGLNHVVGLTHDGQVLTWGSNYFGALGRPTRNFSQKANLMSDRDSIDQELDGYVSGVSTESDSELTNDDIKALARLISTPLEEIEAMPGRVSFKGVLKTGEEIVQVTATDHGSFALSNTGTVYGWGVFLNDEGALGISKSRIQQKYYRSSDMIPANELIAQSPERIDCPENVQKISGGANHLIFVDNTGDLWAVGAGGQGQLGRRLITRFQAEALVARQVGSKMRVERVRTGSHHSYAIDNKGRVFSWGLNNYGQTGNRTDHLEHDDAFQILQPTLVQGFEKSHVVDIDGGMHHGIACTEAGVVMTWGRCDDAQIGLERNELEKLDETDFVLDADKRRCVSLEKVTVPNLHGAVAVSAGRDNNFVIDGENHLWAWGYGGEYQTGLDTCESQAAPQRVKGELSDADKVSWVESRGSFTFIGVEVVQDI